jgi:hypothetical protein
MEEWIPTTHGYDLVAVGVQEADNPLALGSRINQHLGNYF